MDRCQHRTEHRTEQNLVPDYNYQVTIPRPYDYTLIESFPEKYQQVIFITEEDYTLDQLYSQEEWKIRVDQGGSYLLLNIVCDPDERPISWRPTIRTPVHIESIWDLSIEKMIKLAKIVGCRPNNSARFFKTRLFKCLAAYLAEHKLLFPHESKLITEQFFRAVDMPMKDILEALGKDEPDLVQLQKMTTMRLCLEYADRFNQTEIIAPDDLLTMAKSNWKTLAEDLGISFEDDSTCRELVTPLILKGRLKEKYSFLGTEAFWKAYFNYMEALPVLSKIYDTSYFVDGFICLYYNGMLSIDLEPKRLEMYKRSNELPPIRTNDNNVISILRSLERPRGIVTKEMIFRSSDTLGRSQAQAQRSHGNFGTEISSRCLGLTEDEWINFVRETDLQICDRINPLPTLESIPSPSASQLNNPNSYLDEWKIPTGRSVYHFLELRYIESIMGSRNIIIPSTLEGRRHALAGLDHGCSRWKDNIFTAIEISEGELIERLNSFSPEAKVAELNLKIGSFAGENEFNLPIGDRKKKVTFDHEKWYQPIFNSCQCKFGLPLYEAESYYLAGFLRINLLNSSYQSSLITFATQIKLAHLTSLTPNSDQSAGNSYQNMLYYIESKYNYSETSLNKMSLAELKMKEDGIITTIIVYRGDSTSIDTINELNRSVDEDISDITWKSKSEVVEELNQLVRWPIRIPIELYKKIRILDRNDLIRLVEILYAGNLEMMLRSKSEHLFLLSRGYLPFPFDQSSIEKYRQLVELDNNRKQLVMNYHGYQIDRFNFIKLALEPLTEVDQHIINNDLKSLIDQIGMVIPEGVIEDNYLLENIKYYKPIINRSNLILPDKSKEIETEMLSVGNLHRMKDTEIINGFGVRPLFSNRNDLINQIRRLWLSPGFFESINRKSLNYETTLLTKVVDQNELMIGYGKLDQYHCYEIDELYASFYPGEMNEIIFRIPADSNHRKFSLSAIIELNDLLTNLFIRGIYDHDSLSALHNRIELGIADYHRMDAVLKEIYRDLLALPDKIRSLLKDWFYQLFEAGMYMRRWKGPGYPYPHQAEETEIGKDPSKSDNQSPLGVAMGKLHEIYTTFPDELKEIIKRLKLVRHSGGIQKYELTDTQLYNYFEGIFRGVICIRIASKKIIISAAYYLETFYRTPISGFEPAEIEGIA